MKKSPKYDHKIVDKKWQKEWEKEKVYSPDLKSSKKPFYNLMMFPYPSAEGLHVGNMYAFTGADVYGRFKRMQGNDVFEPIGLDGFGIHSENFAIKVGRHPMEHAKISEKNFYNQLHQIGNGFDWSHKLETYDPDYYKWTQWLFVQMFKNGLAYKDSASVNWCPSCKTVLADEQVITRTKNTELRTKGMEVKEDQVSVCERCGTEVKRRDMSSWFFKITQYADRLLANIEKIDWPVKIKVAQRQWIGKSKGLTIDFKLEESDLKLSVWTKYWETVYGVTFIVVSPEYARDNLLELVDGESKDEVQNYIKISLNKSEQERKAIKEKSGVLMGLTAINPVNGESVPVFVADYVLANVGTGAVMGVPAHDERDFDFAKKYKLKIIQVVSFADETLDKDVANGRVASEMAGKLVNSGKFDGLSSREDGKSKMADWMIKAGIARWETNYHLRDWLISRQRYWGPPIPMIKCSDCGWQPVPEKDLPVLLPDIKDFKPKGDGTSPLHNAPESWKSVACPECGKAARRELDVSDTFLDSAWYFLRYPSVSSETSRQALHDTNTTSEQVLHDTNTTSGQVLSDTESSTSLPFDTGITKNWLPVNAYIGGAEHAVLHLLYARFVTMFLKDQGYLTFEEPFPFLFGHGLIIKDGAKMSKSKGNIVNPDEYIEKFGADTLRTYLMFLGPFDQGGDFRDTGIEGMNRFLQRVWRLFNKYVSNDNEQLTNEARTKMHRTINFVGSDVAKFKYNTAIAKIMEYVNYLEDKETNAKEALEVLLKLMAPFAPHMTEELWREKLGFKTTIHTAKWPDYDDKYLFSDKVSIIVQVNGKLRATYFVDIEKSKDKEYIISEAKKLENVAKWIVGNIKKEIFVEGKLVNFVV